VPTYRLAVPADDLDARQIADEDRQESLEA